MALRDELDRLRSEVVKVREELESRDRTIAGLHHRLRSEKTETEYWRRAYENLRDAGNARFADAVRVGADEYRRIMAAEDELADHGVIDASDAAYSRID